MRTLLVLSCLLLAACGSLYDTLPDGGAGAGGGGGGGNAPEVASCIADDPCTCEPCTATPQCATGLQCVTARRHGTTCADSRLVCATGP